MTTEQPSAKHLLWLRVATWFVGSVPRGRLKICSISMQHAYPMASTHVCPASVQQAWLWMGTRTLAPGLSFLVVCVINRSVWRNYLKNQLFCLTCQLSSKNEPERKIQPLTPSAVPISFTKPMQLELQVDSTCQGRQLVQVLAHLHT